MRLAMLVAVLLCRDSHSVVLLARCNYYLLDNFVNYQKLLIIRRINKYYTQPSESAHLVRKSLGSIFIISSASAAAQYFTCFTLFVPR